VHVAVDLASDLRRFARKACDVEFSGRRSVKDLVESLGVPHVEIGRVTIEGVPASVDDVLDGDAAPDVQLRVDPPADLHMLPPRFAADGHLGRLAAYLRALGADTLHRNAETEADFVVRASREDRIVLSRDVALLKLAAVRHGAFVRTTDPQEQLAEIVTRFGLAGRTQPFTRCLTCNELLVPAARDDVASLVPLRVFARFSEFERCPSCGGVFWRGTHRARLEEMISAATRAPS
jgi:uncharacterized protein with PIN domain